MALLCEPVGIALHYQAEKVLGYNCGDEADSDTGYHLELYKDEKDWRKAKPCPKVCLFIAEPIIEARAALQTEEGKRSRSIRESGRGDSFILMK